MIMFDHIESPILKARSDYGPVMNQPLTPQEVKSIYTDRSRLTIAAKKAENAYYKIQCFSFLTILSIFSVLSTTATSMAIETSISCVILAALVKFLVWAPGSDKIIPFPLLLLTGIGTAVIGWFNPLAPVQLALIMITYASLQLKASYLDRVIERRCYIWQKVPLYQYRDTDWYSPGWCGYGRDPVGTIYPLEENHSALMEIERDAKAYQEVGAFCSQVVTLGRDYIWDDICQITRLKKNPFSKELSQ